MDELELEQDPAFQRREWSVQRAGWWGLTAFVAAALLGLFGSGPLSHGRAGAPGAPLWIEYERFTRVGAPERLSVHLDVPPDPNGTRELRINREYFEGMRIERITPEPDRMLVNPDEVRLVFDLASAGAGDRTVIFDVQPIRAGRRAAQISTADATRLTFTQFAYF